MADSRKRKQLSVEAKYQIIMACDGGVKKEADIACDFEIPRNTLSTIARTEKRSSVHLIQVPSHLPARSYVCPNTLMLRKSYSPGSNQHGTVTSLCLANYCYVMNLHVS